MGHECEGFSSQIRLRWGRSTLNIDCTTQFDGPWTEEEVESKPNIGLYQSCFSDYRHNVRSTIMVDCLSSDCANKYKSLLMYLIIVVKNN